MRVLVAFACTSVLAACTSAVSETAGCTVANCEAMLGTCNTGLSDDPDYAWCISNTPSAPDGGMFPPDPNSCAQVCTSDEEGIFVQCIATNAAECVGAGAPPGLVEQCQTEQLASEKEKVSALCDNACQVTRAQCQGACALTDFNTCYQCSLDCSLTAIACRHSCPAELPHCIDGMQDDGEDGVDCGGACGPCPEGAACSTNIGCVSDTCEGGVCGVVIACADADAGVDGGTGACPNDTCLYGTCR